MARLVDSLLRGRAQPSARSEAAAAVSDVRLFVRAWRPTDPKTSEAEAAARASRRGRGGGDDGGGEGRGDGDGNINSAEGQEEQGGGGTGGSTANRPSADVLLGLAQVRWIRGSPREL